MTNLIERLRAGGPCVESGNKCRSMTARDGCICAEAADALASERAKQAERPVWSEDYTCGCGIYVHPAQRIGRSMEQAFHISDCPYAAPPAVQAEPVLLNLALRLRLARRCLKRALSSGANQIYIGQLRGAETEAWNSFQAAKALASPPAVQVEPVADPFADVRDRRISELTEEQHDRAAELWLRNNKGYTSHPDAIERVMRVIDRLRAAPPAVQQAGPVAWRDALEDCHGALAYIRSVHGDLYGVGWDRCMDKAAKALAAPPADDEAVRLLREAREWVVSNGECAQDAADLRDEIDAYLARALP